MKQQEPVPLPSFIKPPTADNWNSFSCHRCRRPLTPADVTAAGVSIKRTTKVCFAFDLYCDICKRTTTITRIERPLDNPNWWSQIAQWHGEASRPKQPPIRHSTKHNSIPLLVGPTPLKRFIASEGYRGDVGPVLIWVNHPSLPNGSGVIRLERNDQIRIKDGPDDENMPLEGWSTIAHTPPGELFVHAGRPWFRLRASEIEEIVRDRVFTIARPAKTVTVRTKSQSKKKGN